jgi:hypothetical protein
VNDPASRYDSVPTYRRATPDGGEQRLRTPRLPDAPEVDQHHRVVAGERLDHLAARFLGDPYAWWQVADAHPGVEVDDLDRPGRRLGVPRARRRRA